jgi:hypothetical protein
MTDRELMQQALEALQYASDETKPKGLYGCECLICKTILALRDRLAQPEQEPVAWAGLTDDELEKVFPAIATYHEANKTLYRSIARAIEAKLREKNT